MIVKHYSGGGITLKGLNSKKGITKSPLSDGDWELYNIYSKF